MSTCCVHVVLVALKNREVRVYKDRFLVNTITLEVRRSRYLMSGVIVLLSLQDVVVGMRFGRFGREDGALILVSQGGALTVNILTLTRCLWYPIPLLTAVIDMPVSENFVVL